MFKSLAHKLTNLLVKNNIIKEDEYEIYRYGFEMLVYFIVNISIALFIGIIFNRFIQTVIFLLCYSTVRQFSGGYHARNYTECTLTFVFICVITNLIDMNIDIRQYKYILIVICILNVFIITKLSPLEHRNKPLSDNEKKHYKKVVVKLTTIISIIVTICLVCNAFERYIIYALFAIVWISILLFIGTLINNYK